MDRLISLQAAIDAARDWYEGLICGSFKGLEKQLRALPSAQPEPIKITIDHVPTQDELERLKQAMRNTPVILLPSAQPEITPDGTLKVTVDADIANVGRILLSQAGTQRGGLYYKDAEPEIIHCAECKWLQCNMRQDGTLPKGVDEFECRHWCGYCDPMDFCSHAERRTDEPDK